MKATEETCNNLIARGSKALALKGWEEAVGLFGEALENMYVAPSLSSIFPFFWSELFSFCVLSNRFYPISAITRSARVLFEIALISRREIYDEFDPKMAPVLLNYGKALFELGFSQQGVMGKEEVEKTAEGGTFHLPLFSMLRFVLIGSKRKSRGGR